MGEVFMLFCGICAILFVLAVIVSSINETGSYPKSAARSVLRDRFAAAAMSGLLSSMKTTVYAEEAASDAYMIADAMLAAREAKR